MLHPSLIKVCLSRELVGSWAIAQLQFCAIGQICNCNCAQFWAILALILINLLALPNIGYLCMRLFYYFLDKLISSSFTKRPKALAILGPKIASFYSFVGDI